MTTLLLSPEMFLAEGGIARIMRLYLRALCETAQPGDALVSVVLNDADAPEHRLPDYSTPALRYHSGCGRSKARFAIETIIALPRTNRIICGHLHQLSVAWAAQKVRPSLRYYLIAHGIEVWRPYSVLERLALRGAHRILCVSDYTRRQLLRFCPGLDPARLIAIPNTLDPRLAQPVAETAGAGTRLDGPVILTVGRLTSVDRYKGVDTLIEALPLIRRELPLARLRIVGEGDDRPRLEALAHQLGVSSSCQFVGFVPDGILQEEYAACDLFALPSRKEGFGLVFLEAMVRGKPCVGSRAGGIPEVVHEAVGALATYGNLNEIAAAVIDVVRRPRDPGAIRAHAESFAFPHFKHRLTAAFAA